MGKVLETIDSELATWMEAQPLFFVATAPLSADGYVNCSPKGGDAFRVLGPLEAAYLDFTGSGIETVAHLRENGRIVIMFCAFSGKPNIVRLHGIGDIITDGHEDWEALSALFSPNPGARAVIRIRVSRVSTSCGFSVPLMTYEADRDVLDRWAIAKGEEGLREYRALKNTTSLDGLPALNREDLG